ncbi:hypothetical protein [Cellulophaga fucicola]|uniref:Uncharacterized protein n=1 Tax=Cellulophaga fucicola TaxID=76595 RepID=A0A1K1Q987_9FLAO|nr:hypothetical protein [Cellulophaga fucicola]SFW56265.1 hypothetical protein SAMN05660313_02466 [Cellulophaga fucicola]
MKIVKLILGYILWAILICLSSLGLVRLWIGPKKIAVTFLEQLMDWGYGLTLMIDSALIASITTVLFILLDVFILRKKLKPNHKPIGIKLILALVLTAVVGVIFLLINP